MTIPDVPAPVPTPPVPVATPAPTPPAPVAPEPLHDDPAIAKALEGLTDEQREQLLTQGGKSALTKTKDRLAAAQQAAAAAADQAKAELAQTLGKALGLVEDDAADPAKLTEALTTAQAAAKQSQLELAVYQASANVANAALLLDSRAFLAEVAAIDPTDVAALGAAITKAVTANPSLALAAASTSRLPAPNPALGSSALGAPDAQAVIDKARASGDWKTVVAMENQKLLNPQQ